MPSANILIGRQPIVDRDERTVAFELLFRSADSRDCARIDCADDAAMSVAIDTIVGLGFPAVLGSCRGFFNVTASVLQSDLVELLPPEHVVVEILESVEVTPAIIARCQQLKEHGIHLAIDDWVPNDPREPLLPYVDVVKVDLPAFEPAGLRAVARRLKRLQNVRLLAEKVETRREFEQCRRMGFELFQGFYFARPALVEARRVDPEQAALLAVLEKLNQNLDVVELVDALKPHPNLGIALLRLANSSGYSPAQKISRIEDAIAYVGRAHLVRWVSLLLFTTREGGARGPILMTAAHRARLMELLAKDIGGLRDGNGDAAFLVGLLSLVDALLGRPRAEVVPELNLDEASSAALLGEEGLLGTLLALTEAFQTDRFEEMGPHLDALGLSASAFRDADQQSFEWLTGLLADLGDAPSLAA